ncbi:hypothetical protein AB0J43_07445 [Nonomuraea fuscirosea]
MSFPGSRPERMLLRPQRRAAAIDLADDSSLADDDTVDLRAWQNDFLSFLHTEGLQRHPDHWRQACEQWSRGLSRTGRNRMKSY